MSSEDQATSEHPEASATEERHDGGDSTDWRAKSTQLLQENAQLRHYAKEAVPWVQTAQKIDAALRQAEGGTQILEAIYSGKTLSSEQTKQVAKAMKVDGEARGLTREEIREEFQAFAQELQVQREAEKDMLSMHEKASKELPGYSEIAKTPQWSHRLNTVIQLVRSGAIPIPDDEPSPNYFLIKETWATMVRENPDIGKERPAKKSESERKAAISTATSTSGGAPPSDTSDMPGWYKKLGEGAVFGGKRSFASFRRQK